ncbi:hypothetical protein R3W88_023361 [Solanum pinnatisectum]|uniref:Brf1 TBP-binding domain-containing protein n=1 Tax=Solanum pinnatisectum TaxID=50273 RepID=A0AAV9LXE1_9SOLN|nr:hypothetical protein R3W88_023361 [Solanum pinnatisectum]
MAITGRPSDNGKSTEQRVVGVSEVKSNLVADGVRHVKNLNACKAKFQDIDQRKRVAAAGNLSGIDDSEVVGYLNNRKEIHYKKIIWEKMNKEFAKGDDKLHAKKRKREIGHKKDVHAKKSAKTTDKVENKRTSSKINYNALQKLTDELKQVPVEAELGGLEPKACANSDSAENLKIGFHELERENEYGEYDDSFRENDDDSYYGYGTGYYNNSEDFDAEY